MTFTNYVNIYKLCNTFTKYVNIYKWRAFPSVPKNYNNSCQCIEHAEHHQVLANGPSLEHSRESCTLA